MTTASNTIHGDPTLKTTLMAVVALACAVTNANADDLRGRYLHLGGVQISPNPNSVGLTVAGVAVPDAAFNAGSEIGVAAEFGWFFHENWAISATVTSSVLTENIGVGALAPTPQLGSDSFMLAALTGHYHYGVNNWLRPYIGGGVGYFHSTGAYDGLVSNLSIDDAFGGVLQAGADFDLTDRWGAFLDIKQFLIGVNAVGSMGGLPVDAEADLDPLLINSGLTYRF